MRRVRFEGLEFDVTTGDLIRDGRRITRLQEQPRVVLATLIAHPSHLISREELHHRLWPTDTLVDAQNGLNIAINKIRLALGDSATSPRFIETVPRRGYRFIADVHPVEEKPEPRCVDEPASIVPAMNAPATVIPSARRLFLGLVLVLGISAVLTMLGARDDEPRVMQSLAVLPFVNLLGSDEHDYIARGLEESLATELAARGVPRVISPAAAAYFAIRKMPAEQIARELDAAAVIAGSLVRDGAGFAVNVQLIAPGHDGPVWASRFRRATPLEVSFSEDIVSELAEQLGLDVSLAQRSTPAIPATARDAYLRGRFLWNQRTPAAVRASVEHLTRAIQEEPEYALAWAGLADAYALGTTVPSAAIAPWPADPVVAGVYAADRALKIDPELGEAHSARGKLLMAQWRWGEAEREFATAVRWSPNYAPARQWYGTLLARLQKCDAALEQVRIGARIDPVTPIVNEAVGSTLSMCGQPSAAVAAHQRVIELHPTFATAHMGLGSAHYRLGSFAAAEAALRKALDLRPGDCQIRARLTAVLYAQRKREAATWLSDIVRDVGDGGGGHYCAVLAEASAGNVAAALEQLEFAYSRREGGLDLLLVDPLLNPVRGQRQFQSVLGRVGLLPYSLTSRE